MYNVNVNGRTVASESSYEKAVAAAKAAAIDTANSILSAANAVLVSTKLYRSPKSRRNVAANMSRQAINLGMNAKFPKKAGDVNLRTNGVTLSIVKA